MREFLEDIKAGDEVLLSGGGWGQPKKRIMTVSRTTKTQIIIGDSRYNKKSGYPVGSNSGSWERPNSIGPFTEDDRIDIKRNTAISMLDKIQWDRFDNDSLFEIAAFVHKKKSPVDKEPVG